MPKRQIKNRGAIKFKADDKRRFCEVLSYTGQVQIAAKATGFSRPVVYEHRAKDPKFAKAWDEALKKATPLMREEAYRRAVPGVRKPVYQGGKKVGYIQEYSDRLLMFLMTAAEPHIYRDRVQISGDPTEPITINKVDLSPALADLMTKFDVTEPEDK